MVFAHGNIDPTLKAVDCHHDHVDQNHSHYHRQHQHARCGHLSTTTTPSSLQHHHHCTITTASSRQHHHRKTITNTMTTISQIIVTTGTYQGGVSPAGSNHLRRRVTQSMFEANGYVNYWTEFLLAHVGSLHDYTLDYADTSLASSLWDQAPIDMGKACPTPLGMANYSLSAYLDPVDHLVHKTPKPLVDWPRSSGIDTDATHASHCKELCVQMNAYAVQTQTWMADLADRLGLHEQSEAYAQQAASTRASTQATFALAGSQCGDGQPPVATCAVEWEKDSHMHHHNSTGVVVLNCGKNKQISRVVFADFGTPSGTCDGSQGFKKDLNCTSPPENSAVAVVESQCLHHQFCTLHASDKVFGDGCRGVCKRLAVQVMCAPTMRDGDTKRSAGNSTANGHNSVYHNSIVDANEFHCYADNPVQRQPANDAEISPSTTATGSALAAFVGLPGNATSVLSLLPFLRARQSRLGTQHGLMTSGWMTGFMLEGLYVAAGEVDQGLLDLAMVSAAVEYCHTTLVNDGQNSWLGMLKQNATMTMESWSLPPWEDEGGGTFSHPWTASPARVIPRYLMGVRPLQDGWRRLTIRPLPARALTSATLQITTLRGVVLLSFRATPSAFEANFTVPGNTKAQVCLPRYLFADSATCVLRVGGEVLPASRAGGLLCVDSDFGGGSYSLLMGC